MNLFQGRLVVRSAAFILLLALLINTSYAGEKITLFNSDIQILPDRSLHVTETISVVAENVAIKHGIYRDFPTMYPMPGAWGDLGFRDKTGFDIDSILFDGESVEWRKVSLKNGVRLYIGDPDHYVTVGAHEYQIRYTTTHQIARLNNQDTLNWNVTGQAWVFPIDHVVATVNLPDNQAGGEYSAWTGRSGSEEQAYQARVNTDSSTIFETTRGLSTYEGLTISMVLPEGAVDTPRIRAWAIFSDNILLILSLLLLLGLPLYYLRTWRAVGRDPQPGVIVADYSPVRGLSAAAHRFILNNHVDNQTYTAALLGMAVKGRIRIVQNSKKSFTVYKQPLSGSPKNDAKLSPGEQRVFDVLFSKDNSINLSKTYDPLVAASKKKLGAFLTKEWRDAVYVDNRHFSWFGLLIGSASLLFGGLHLNNMQLEFPLILPILALVVLGLVLSQPGIKLKTLLFTGVSLFAVLKGFSIAMLVSPWLVWMTGLLLLIYLLFNYLLRAPTPFGRKLLDEIEGFKLYLVTAEQDRLDILHPPQRTPELFERLLPYAVALGVENRWSEQFTEVFRQQQETDKNYQPSWYQSNTASRLSAASLGSALSSGLSSSVASASTAPSSSSSGGGGAGGGGGGGGGGGW